MKHERPWSHVQYGMSGLRQVRFGSSRLAVMATCPSVTGILLQPNSALCHSSSLSVAPTTCATVQDETTMRPFPTLCLIAPFPLSSHLPLQYILSGDVAPFSCCRTTTVSPPLTIFLVTLTATHASRIYCSAVPARPRSPGFGSAQSQWGFGFLE